MGCPGQGFVTVWANDSKRFYYKWLSIFLSENYSIGPISVQTLLLGTSHGCLKSAGFLQFLLNVLAGHHFPRISSKPCPSYIRIPSLRACYNAGARSGDTSRRSSNFADLIFSFAIFSNPGCFGTNSPFNTSCIKNHTATTFLRILFFRNTKRLNVLYGGCDLISIFNERIFGILKLFYEVFYNDITIPRRSVFPVGDRAAVSDSDVFESFMQSVRRPDGIVCKYVACPGAGSV